MRISVEEVIALLLEETLYSKPNSLTYSLSQFSRLKLAFFRTIAYNNYLILCRDYSRVEVAADATLPPEADGPFTANALQHSRCGEIGSPSG
jgi:hypothetical protein